MGTQAGREPLIRPASASDASPRPADLPRAARSFLLGWADAHLGTDMDWAVERKRRHSLRVAGIATALARLSGLPTDLRRLIRAAGFLHDLGRFPQLAAHGTYDDATSLNHGRLSARILTRKGRHLLAGLDAGERKILLTAVNYHNRALAPAGLPLHPDTALRILRDADKIDVLGVVAADLEAGNPLRRLVGPGISTDPAAVTPEVLRALAEGRPAPYAAMAHPTDILLFYAGWLYDLNHAAGARLLLRRGILKRILAHVPERDPLASLRDQLLHDLRSRTMGTFPREVPD